MLNILELNEDCILHVLYFCEDRDLFNLCRTHKRFQKIIDQYIFSVKTLDLLMCGHRNNPPIGKRTHTRLSNSSRLMIANNWLMGSYCEYEYFYHSLMFPTKLHLEREALYVTHASHLRQYRRQYKEPINYRYVREINTNDKSDIACFVKKGDTIFAGRIYGNCYIHEGNGAIEQRLHSPKEYMYSLDFEKSVYVTSTDHCIKLWRREDELGIFNLELFLERPQAYKCLKLNEGGSKLYGGLYTDVNGQALRELDVESGIETVFNSKTISIYDLKLKDDNIIYTANFDTTFRVFDRRTNRDESIWEDPFDSSFYCLEHDGLYGVLCGAKYYSRVNLYDTRVPGKFMQLYFTYHRHRNSSSPVYSMACDSRYLFVATDHSMTVLDFKGGYGSGRDYRDIFPETYRIRA